MEGCCRICSGKQQGEETRRDINAQKRSFRLLLLTSFGWRKKSARTQYTIHEIHGGGARCVIEGVMSKEGSSFAQNGVMKSTIY